MYHGFILNIVKKSNHWVLKVYFNITIQIIIYFIIYFLVPKHTGSFYLDVEKKVNQLIINKGYLKSNSFSPYGYKLDFELILNSSNQLRSAKKNEK